MSTTTTAPLYCVNHPGTETLIRCYRCGKPVCIKCVTRTPVGLICKDCLGQQRSGYYTAGVLEYVLTAVIGFVLGLIGAVIALALSGLWFLAIFYGPFAGGIIAEGIRLGLRKQRGRYIWLIACATVILAGLFVMGGPSLFLALLTGQLGFLGRGLFNFGLLGFGIYLVLAVGTIYARLRV